MYTVYKLGESRREEAENNNGFTKSTYHFPQNNPHSFKYHPPTHPPSQPIGLMHVKVLGNSSKYNNLINRLKEREAVVEEVQGGPVMMMRRTMVMILATMTMMSKERIWVWMMMMTINLGFRRRLLQVPHLR